MKKIIILFLVFFVLVSCQKKENNPTSLQKNRQETLDKEVINAISKNNFTLTQKLISEGADIHSIANKEYDLFSQIVVPPNRIITSAQFEEMYELLQEEFLQAIEEENFDVIENLINKGIDINMTGYELKPLDFSQEYARPMMKYLFEKGLDIKKQKDVLIYALRSSDGEMPYLENIEYLIEKGADVNAKDNDGDSPLSLAKERGYKEIVTLLLANGAKGNTPAVVSNGNNAVPVEQERRSIDEMLEELSLEQNEGKYSEETDE